MYSTHHSPEGVITATVTPMDADLKADLVLLSAHCKHLLADGGDGIVLLGTTGEANSFSVTERKGILEGLLREGIDADVVIVGTGCCALTDTIELTKHAMQCGVRHVLMLPPFYYKPVSDDALFQYYQRVIENVNDTHLRVYLYHIPKNTGIDLSLDLIGRLINQFPGIVAGMKDSGGDWKHMETIMREFPIFRLYSGTEDYLIDTLRAGGVGCISATTNVTMAIAAKVMRAYRNNENTDEGQKLLIRLRNVFRDVPFVGAIKGFLELDTNNPSWHHLRPPNEALDHTALLKLKETFAHILHAPTV